ncbi:hypothetical protein MC885_013221 [Smutsia gigantea]|nr:hypothetical protein MC885_013221 [Smutsia gigantea]
MMKGNVKGTRAPEPRTAARKFRWELAGTFPAHKISSGPQVIFGFPERLGVSFTKCPQQAGNAAPQM